VDCDDVTLHSYETMSRLAWSRDGSRLATVRDHDQLLAPSR
jgi:hypothetical protein